MASLGQFKSQGPLFNFDFLKHRLVEPQLTICVLKTHNDIEIWDVAVSLNPNNLAGFAKISIELPDNPLVGIGP